MPDTNPGQAVDPHRVAQRDPVQPAAAPRTARRRSVLVSALPDTLALVVQKFRRKRARADACGVRLDDAENLIDGGWEEPRFRYRRRPKSGARTSHRGRCRRRCPEASPVPLQKECACRPRPRLRQSSSCRRQRGQGVPPEGSAIRSGLPGPSPYRRTVW